MPSTLECKKRTVEMGLGSSEREAFHSICDVLVVRVVEDILGKRARDREPFWPQARIMKWVGTLCSRHGIFDPNTLTHYITLVHETRAPVREYDHPDGGPKIGFPRGISAFLVKQHLRENCAEMFTDQGRRRLHSLAKELGLTSIDLFGAISILAHELADELATSCGGPDAQE